MVIMNGEQFSNGHVDFLTHMEAALVELNLLLSLCMRGIESVPW